VVDDGRVLAHQLVHRDAVHAGDLLRVGRKPARGLAAPDDDRRDRIARARGVVVEPAEDGRGVQHEADLLAQFAQRRLLGRFALVDAATGQRPLAGVLAHAAGAQGQQQRGRGAPLRQSRDAVGLGAVALLDDDQRDRRAAHRRARRGLRREALGAHVEGVQAPLQQIAHAAL